MRMRTRVCRRKGGKTERKTSAETTAKAAVKQRTGTHEKVSDSETATARKQARKHESKLNYLKHFNFLIHYDRPNCGFSDKN